MNEEYLQGFFDTYVKPKRPDANYNDWVSKISSNEEYKQGMFNTYVKPAKADATYEDWNSKIFGQKKTSSLSQGAVGQINPAVANAFDVSRKGKELQKTIKAQNASLATTLNDYANKRVAELQPLVKTEDDVKRANETLKNEIAELYKSEAAKADKEIGLAYDSFQQAANSQFADKDFAKGFQETYVPEKGTDINKWRLTDSKIGKSLADKFWSAITDQLPGGLASGMAGSLTTDYGDVLYDKAKSAEKQRLGIAYNSFKKTKEEVVSDYIAQYGQEQFDKESSEFTKVRTEKKESLLKYASEQRGEGEGKLYKYPKTWEEAKNTGRIGEYVAGNIGQVGGLAVPTLTASAINPTLGAFVGYSTNSMMEKGEAYEQGINLLKKNTGLSREELFKTNTDALLRDASSKSGLVNGLLEYIGQMSAVGKMIPKSFVSELLGKVSQSGLVRVPIGTLTEGVTEWLQAKDTHFAAAIGSGQSPEKALDYALNQDDSEEFIAGLTGGGGMSVISNILSSGNDSNTKKSEVNTKTPNAEVGQPIPSTPEQGQNQQQNALVENVRVQPDKQDVNIRLEPDKVRPEPNKQQSKVRVEPNGNQVLQNEPVLESEVSNEPQSGSMPVVPPTAVEETAKEGGESRIQSWNDAFAKAKEDNDTDAIENLYGKIKIALNGVVQGRIKDPVELEATIKEFESLKTEIEQYANEWKQSRQSVSEQTQQPANNPSAAQPGNPKTNTEVPGSEGVNREVGEVDKNPNLALNMEFLTKGIGSALIKKDDGYYYHVNGVLTKIPNQKRAEKAFNDSKENEREVNAMSEEDKAKLRSEFINPTTPDLQSISQSTPDKTAAKEVNLQQEKALSDAIDNALPDLNYLTEDELLNTSSPVNNKLKQKNIKKEQKQLKLLIECLMK